MTTEPHSLENHSLPAVTSRAAYWLEWLGVELAAILFFVPAGRISFEFLRVSTGYDAYKLFPLLFLTWWLWRRETKGRPWPQTPLLFPLFAFFVLACLSSISSVNPYESITETIEIGCYFLFLVMLIDVPWSEKHLRWAALGFIIGNLYMGIVALWEYREALLTQALPRINATYDYPNALAVYALLGFTLLAWLMAQTNRAGERTLIAVAMACTLFALAFSLSRAGYLGLLVGGAVMASRGNRQQRIWIGGLLLLFAIMALWSTPQILSRLTSITREASQPDMASRLHIWSAVMDQETPNFFIFGVGLGPNIATRMTDRIASGPDPHALTAEWHPHNLYLDLLFSMGIFGLAAFAWIGWTVWMLLKDRRDAAASILGAGFVAYLVHQFFEVHLLLGNIPVALTVMLALAGKCGEEHYCRLNYEFH